MPPQPSAQARKVLPLVVASVAEQAGFKGDDLHTAVAVSFAENRSHDRMAVHKNSDGSEDVGLWQINSVHGFTRQEMFDAQANANAAYKIWSDAGDFGPWTTYTNKTYLAFLPTAKSAVKGRHAGAFPGADAVSGLVPNIGGWVGDLKNWLGEYVGRAFMMLGGLVLLLMGIVFIAKSAGASVPLPGR